MQEIKIHDFPGKQIRLKYPASDEIPSQMDLTLLAIGGIFSLGKGLFEILKIDFSFAYFDAELDLKNDDDSFHSFWMLKQTVLPDYLLIRPTWVNEKTSLVEVISQEEVLNLIKQVMISHKPNDGNVIGWDQISLDTNCCLLPVSLEDLDNGEVSVTNSSYSNTYQLPVEVKKEAVWISGPIRSQTLNAPIEISLRKEYGEITLDISLHWSVYTTPDTIGSQKVQENVDKLLAKGWLIDED